RRNLLLKLVEDNAKACDHRLDGLLRGDVAGKRVSFWKEVPFHRRFFAPFQILDQRAGVAGRTGEVFSFAETLRLPGLRDLGHCQSLRNGKVTEINGSAGELIDDLR